MPNTVSPMGGNDVLLFALSALRAIVEMLGLCLIGQAVVGVMAGPRRDANVVYRLFALVTQAPRSLVGYLLPAHCSERAVGIVCFIILFVFWVGLAILRKSI